MKEIITEYWNDKKFWGSCYGVEWTDELEEQMKIDMKRAIKEHCQLIYKRERVKCDICGCHLQRGSLSRHKKTKKCKAHPNDKYILVDGRTYLKGESPLEGVWHSDHTPFEVKKYVIFEKGVPRGISI